MSRCAVLVYFSFFILTLYCQSSLFCFTPSAKPVDVFKLFTQAIWIMLETYILYGKKAMKIINWINDCWVLGGDNIPSLL